MTDEQLLEYRRVKLLGRDKKISELIAVNTKLREGISLRDHFACAAMQALMGTNLKYSIMIIAIDAYKMADAMLAEKRDDH